MTIAIRILIGLAVILIAAVSSTPFAIRYLGERWLADQGVPAPQIGSVTLNPFTGSVEVSEIDISGPELPATIDMARANLEWLELLRGRILLRDVHLGEVNLAVFDHGAGRIEIGGLSLPLQSDPAPPEARSEPAAPQFGLQQVLLDDIRFLYASERFRQSLHLRHLTVDELATWLNEQHSALRFELHIADGTVQGEVRAKPLAASPTAAFDLHIEGIELSEMQHFLEPLNTSLTGELAAELIGELTLNGTMTQLDSKVDLALADVTWTDPAASLQAETSNLNGTVNLRLDSASPALPAIAAQADLRAAGLRLRVANPALSVSLDLNELAVTNTALRSDQLSIASVDLSKLTAAVTRHPPAEPVEGAEGPKVSPVPPTEAGVSRPPAIRIGRVTLGGDAPVQWTDASFEPALQTAVTITQFELTDIDSSAAAPVQIALALAQGDSGTLALNGWLAPFGDVIDADLDVQVRQIDLPQFSQYIPGYNIDRGRINLQSRGLVDAGALNISNALTIQQLKLVGVADGEPGWLAEGQGMPLDVMLDLLRDGDGVIALEVPIAGSLDDPEFGTGQVMQVAVRNAMQKAAMLYAKTALQPLGTILFVANMAGKAARPQFDPIAFAPGSAALSSTAQAYLDKVAELLGSRPGLTITFCGIATESDRISMMPVVTDSTAPLPEPIQDESLLELAVLRRSAVFDHLHSERGVADERLFNCKASIDNEQDATPRVRVQL